MIYNVDADTMTALGVTSHSEAVQRAAEWGFKTPQGRALEVVQTVDEIMASVAHWEKARHDLDFAIDGLVVKVNRYSQQKRLGMTAKSPRWALAYKFETERVSTTLQGVKYQVGRTGAVTPVADLLPVQLGGTTVKNASLHNADQIAKLGLREGDTVFVEKGGEIIPKIVGVDGASSSAGHTVGHDGANFFQGHQLLHGSGLERLDVDEGAGQMTAFKRSSTSKKAGS